MKRSPDWLTRLPVAHRGFHDADQGVIENSVSAISASISKGYAIEVDIQLTADGDAVVFHDHDLDRLTEETGPILDHSMEDLSKIKLARSKDFIHSLKDILALVDGRVPLIIELKTRSEKSDRLIERVIDLVTGYNGPVAVMSFDPRPIAYACKNAPGLVRGIVSDGVRDLDYWRYLSFWQRLSMRYFLHLPWTRPHFFNHDITHLPSLVSTISRMNKVPLLTWTVRTEAHRSIAAQHADQIVFEGFEADVP